jgi:hypothetical protein
MKRVLLAVTILAATTLAAQQRPDERVAIDAAVIDRVAEASKRDLPVGLLQRIITQDIEWLRVPRTDGTYEYASYERFEAGRETHDFSIQPKGDKTQTVEARGAFIYRVILESPSRRLMVVKNRPVYIERVDIEYLPQGSSRAETQSVEINALLQPGEVRPIDIPVVARQVTVRVQARADEKSGYGNIVVSLVQARIVDNPQSPYAGPLASARAIQRALANNDVPSTRAMAARMRDALNPAVLATAVRPDTRVVTVTPLPPSPQEAKTDSATELERYTEMQLIEDLLTGNEAERREGMDKLHQLVRRMRPR